MADLRFDNPKTTEDFAAAMAACGVKLPINFDEGPVGSVVDADGKQVFVVDVDRELSDRTCFERASWIICAVNICGGFIAVRSNG